MQRNPELESSLLEKRFGSDAWAVYGDWLQTQDNPRGELIALELARETDGETPEGNERIDALLKSLHEGWMDSFEWSPKEPGVMFWKEAKHRIELTWKKGFIDGVDVTLYLRKNNRAGLKLMEKFLNSFSSNFLAYFRMHLEYDSNIDAYSFFSDFQYAVKLPQTIQASLSNGHSQETDFASILSSFPGLKSLRLNGNITIKDFSFLQSLNELSISMIERKELARELAGTLSNQNLPELSVLKLDIPRVEYQTDPIDFLNTNKRLKKLKSLHVAFRLIELDSLSTLSKINFPLLKELHIIGGAHYDKVAMGWDSFSPFFQSASLPSLRILEINIYKGGKQTLQKLTSSPILPGLKALSLLNNNLRDEGAEILLKHFDSFKHLAINLENTGLSDEMKTKLKAVYGDMLWV